MKIVFLIALSTFLCALRGSAQWAGSMIDTLTNNNVRDEVDAQAIAVDDSDNLHVAWKQANTGGGWRLFYAMKPPAGPWTPPQEIADSTLLIYGYALAVDRSSGKPHVVYERESAVPSEIILSEDSSGTWIETRITENGTDDLSPAITLDANGFVHLAWIGQDSLADWKIMYATNLTGVWSTQLLVGSELGPFGSGAAPFIVATASGVVHIFYRGGDFGTYHIHHATNMTPGATVWTYEFITTENDNDFTAQAAVAPDTTLHLLASGNDGFGFPPRAFYLKKPFGGAWTTAENTNPLGTGWGGSLFIDRYGKTHITWNETSGNFYTGNLYYATNSPGSWTSAPILADGATFNGTLVLDSQGRGHAIAYHGETFETQEVFVVHSPSGLTSFAGRSSSHPSKFFLHQNFPNPFNPSTVIRYSLPVDAHVSLKVYDVLGREVATLVGEQKKAGYHEATFDASALASGVYLYRMAARGFSETKKLLISK
jgi:hypothetical protein